MIGRIIFLTPEETSFTPLIGQNSFAYEKSLVSISQYVYLPGVLKTGLPEILSQVQHIAGNLLKLNLLKALILLV